jgi:hypothetical protein
MRRVSAWLPPLVLLAASSAGAAPAPEPKESGRAVIPGGVADAAGAKGFVANADGGVTALDLESGKALWDSKTAGRPVAVAGGRVLVQTADAKTPNALRVVGLDVEKGEKAWESDPIVFPDWAPPVEGQGAGRSFFSRARTGGGALLIAWRADTFYWGGAAPSPQKEAAARKHADGVARIDLESGKVEMLETAKAPSPPGPKVSKELEKAAARRYAPEWDEGMLVATAGDYAVAVDVEYPGGTEKVVLKRWDLTTEKAQDPVVLAEGAHYQVFTLPSAGVTLVRDTAPSEEVKWTVFALATGKETAHFALEPGARDLAVVGPRAYCVVSGATKGPFGGQTLSRTLKAVDLKTGRRLWEQPLEAERLPPPPPR